MAKRKPKLKKDGTPRAKPKWNPNSAFRGALRRVFARSPQVRAVKDRARKEEPKFNKDGSVSKKPRVLFQCAECNKYFKGAHVAVDHIDPVINPKTGYKDWNTFIERLDCPEDNLQVLCSYTKKEEDTKGTYGRYSCHYFKSQEERKVLKVLKVLKDSKNEI
jgi:hypothetical protein